MSPSRVIATPRASTIDVPDNECPHGLSDPSWCATCRLQSRTRGGVRVQVQADGGHCRACDAYLHKGDLVTMVDGGIHCQNCA